MGALHNRMKQALACALSWMLNHGLVIVVGGDERHNGQYMARQVRFRFRTKDAMLWTDVQDSEYDTPNIFLPIDTLTAPLPDFPHAIWDVNLNHTFVAREGAERRAQRLNGGAGITCDSIDAERRRISGRSTDMVDDDDTPLL